MKITIFAAGSQGDIQPCVALAKGLSRAGCQVSLAAPADFTPFVQKHGVHIIPLRGDVKKIMASDTGRKFMDSGGSNPIRSIFAIRSMIAPVVMEMAMDAYTACQGSDAIICLGVFSAFGQSIAEKLDIPLIHVEPTPLLPTRLFPAPSWPLQENLGGVHNTLSGLLMLRVIWLWYAPFVKDFRLRLGLSPMSFGSFYKGLMGAPMLSAYSPRMIPHPQDWPDTVNITGYLFLDPEEEWTPPVELISFLEAGEPPVYIGFGSMAGRSPEQMARIATDALAESSRRGILITGWGGMRTEQISDRVLTLASAPHSWLFPHMAAVVHHGGAGTTAEGLRAGVPSIIVPFILDQPFWGTRIFRLGVGPKPIPQKRLSSHRLAESIKYAVSDPVMKQRAGLISKAIRSEDGVSHAVGIVKRYLGN